jgi:hypothetical protein
MSRTLSDRSVRRFAGTGLVLAAALLVPATARVTAQAVQAQRTAADVVSSEIGISRESASLRLEMADGRSVQLSLRDGGAWIDGARIGDAPRGGDLDREWRTLLNRGMDVPTSEFASMALAWSGPGSVGARLSEAMASALQADAAAVDPDAIIAPAASSADSVDRLLERIAELEAQARAAERSAVRAEREARSEARSARRTTRSPSVFRNLTEGLAGIFSLLVTYIVLFAIGVAVIFFGGRRYIEGVADTARNATTRSLFVGLAASFLVVPAFVLGIVALIISIIGIPGLLVWVPGFPLAVVLGVLLGYLGVAHGAGEALAERRFYVSDWFQRGNAYYFLLTGLGLLLAFFLAANVVHMAGPWFRVIRGLVMFLGGVTTFIALMVGFGAVLISRAGSRPMRAPGHIEEPDLFTEEAGV